MVDLSRKYDVLVIGGGNAALCAAISARRIGASVLVLEGAPKFYRGGNTRHTRNMRCAHDAATDILTGPYPEEEFWEDLLRVTGGQTDEELARHMIAESKDLLGWIVEQGVRWQPSLGGTLSLGRTNSFFLGGGRAMLNALYLTAEQLGVDIVYDAEVIDLEIADGMFLSATVRQHDGSATATAATLVAAAGGFEANIEWLKQYWGEAADNFLIRGTPYNRGSVLKMLLDKGVQEIGDPTQCHAVAIDARAPKFDGGIITRHDSVVFGIVVNKHAQRFYDEGEDIWPKRYAIWGRLVAAQPDQIAYIIFDASEVALGAADRKGALLCLSRAPRHHLHLSRYAREPGGAYADEGRQAFRQHVCRRRDHGGQRARPRICRRHWNDHRQRVRADRRARGGEEGEELGKGMRCHECQLQPPSLP